MIYLEMIVTYTIVKVMAYLVLDNVPGGTSGYSLLQTVYNNKVLEVILVVLILVTLFRQLVSRIRISISRNEYRELRKRHGLDGDDVKRKGYTLDDVEDMDDAYDRLYK